MTDIQSLQSEASFSCHKIRKQIRKSFRGIQPHWEWSVLPGGDQERRPTSLAIWMWPLQLDKVKMGPSPYSQKELNFQWRVKSEHLLDKPKSQLLINNGSFLFPVVDLKYPYPYVQSLQVSQPLKWPNEHDIGANGDKILLRCGDA